MGLPKDGTPMAPFGGDNAEGAVFSLFSATVDPVILLILGPRLAEGTSKVHRSSASRHREQALLVLDESH